MSELRDSSPGSGEGAMGEQDVRAPWTMLVTMCLMIAGFLLASALLVQQSLQVRSPEGEPVFALAVLTEKSKTMVAHASAKEAPAEETPVEEADSATSSPFDGFKDMVMNRSSSDSVKWPRLKVTGFGKSADGTEKFAIINGDLVHPGEFAGKVQLVEVRAHDVVVEFKGERKNLTMDLED